MFTIGKNTGMRIAMTLVLSVLSGVLMYLGWPNQGFFPFIFIGLVPLFFAIEELSEFNRWWRFFLLFLLVFIAHLIWIGGSSYWLHVTSPKTYYTGIILESATLGIILIPLLFVRKRLGKRWGWIYFVASWMTLEWINQNWMAGTPFYVLGEGLGMHPWLIQSYSVIGIEGASLMILLCNVSVYLLIRGWLDKALNKTNFFVLGLSILPFIVSPLLDSKADLSEGSKIRVSVLHSYMETYSDETHLHPEKVIRKLWKLSDGEQLKGSELLVWPETIISNLGWLNNISGEKAYQEVLNGLKEYPGLSVCLGGYGFSLVNDGVNDPYAVKDPSRGFYYTSHNVALTMDQSGRWPIRSKEVFIPFQERIPLLKQFPFMKEFADVVGANTMVSYYEFGDNIHKTNNGNRFVPVLCYESIYPVRMAINSAESEFAVILANEHWNKDLSGSEQYLYSNCCMAVQSGIPIFRSSNSGVSAVIDKTGRVIERRKGKNVGLITTELEKKTELTFYEGIAGIIYKLALMGFIGVLMISGVKRIFSK